MATRAFGKIRLRGIELFARYGLRTEHVARDSSFGEDDELRTTRACFVDCIEHVRPCTSEVVSIVRDHLHACDGYFTGQHVNRRSNNVARTLHIEVIREASHRACFYVRCRFLYRDGSAGYRIECRSRCGIGGREEGFRIEGPFKRGQSGSRRSGASSGDEITRAW